MLIKTVLPEAVRGQSQPSTRSSKVERPSFFIDFEASGIAPDSYPIEVAVVSREISFSSLITHWSFDAQDMHGLCQDQLRKRGDTPVGHGTVMT